MESFGTVSEGLAELHRRNVGARKVYALLTFQHTNSKVCKECFLFESRENAGGQLVKKYDQLKISGVGGPEMQAALAARQVAINAELSEGDPSELGVLPEGHAEEFLIEYLPTAIAQVKDVKFVTIYQTHSPCTTHDHNASHSLQGWPQSCTSKYAALAANHPEYSFFVVFLGKFGFLSGNPAPQQTLKNLSGGRMNLSFIEQRSSPPYERV